MRITDKKVYVSLGILLALTIISWSVVLASSSSRLKISFYDVGQGDAIYIRIPKNLDIIVDGGPKDTILSKLSQDMPFYDRKIELVILTHPHADHVTGLVHILERFEVEQILYSDVSYTSSIYSEWRKLIKEKNIPISLAHAGQIIKLGQARMYILHPTSSFVEKKVQNLNNTSIVGRLVYGKTVFLLPGDIEKEIEAKLVKKYQANNLLRADVLKVGHQGSKTSSSPEFIALVDPTYAIIPVGANNKFGHPHPQTIETLDKANAKILRTDVHGDIKCWSDGEKVNCNYSKTFQ